MASRIEGQGLPGEINISSATYNKTKDFFEFENRGKVKIKNMDSVDMFFVKGIKKELSIDSLGMVPNYKFFSLYKKLTLA